MPQGDPIGWLAIHCGNSSTGAVDGDGIVPADKGCELDGVTVIGNVHVGIGATSFTQISRRRHEHTASSQSARR